MSISQGKVIRTFIGFHVPLELSAIIVQQGEEQDPFGGLGRYLPGGHHHLTLHFFSSIELDRLGLLKSLTREITTQTPSFEVELGEPGFFPSLNKSHVFWWGLALSNPLLELREKLREQLQEKCLPIERESFKPHITIARFRKSPQVSENTLDVLQKGWPLKEKKFTVTQLELFKSPAGPEGYEILDTFPLAHIKE